MKVSRDQMAGNRQAILDAAGLLFRQRGFDSVTVAEVMKAAGLTHGGFYGHFGSKQDLMAQACAALAEHGASAEGPQPQDDPVRYLTGRHRDEPAGGCPFAALGPEAVRQPPAVRTALAGGVRASIDRMSAETGDRAAAIATLAGMVGGLVLARLTQDDAALSDEILAAVKEALAT